MGYIKEYLLLIIVVLLIFHFTGLLSESGSVTSILFQLALHPENIETSDLLSLFNITLGALTLAGVAVGLITRNYDLALWVGMFDVFILIGQDLLGVYNVLRGANEILAVLCVSPLLVIYVLAAVEWVRGM